MSLTSASVSYPPHTRMHQHQQQPYPHPYPHHSDISPTTSHESLVSSSALVSPPIEASHPLYISTTSHHQPSHHGAPYQTPSPPYHHRSNSAELAQKPSLPYPRHSQPAYSSSSHRAHPYSPPMTLPPLTGRPPLSPQSPIDSASNYPMPSSNRDDRHRYRGSSSMSTSPPPSASASANGARAFSPSSSATPLSATDRRERNKAASAKYRAKKHYQSGEMRSQITILQDDNNVLTRQLDECRVENASLKNLVEKLKGRLVAEKVLKRLREVGREKKRRGSGHGAGNHSAAKVSAHDLAVIDDSETDDVVDEMENGVIHGDDDDDMDDFDDEEEEQERRRIVRKAHARRRVTRPEDADKDHHGD